MTERDQIATANRKSWEALARGNCGFSQPWLDLDRELIQAFIDGQLEEVPECLTEMYPRNVLAGFEAKDVLCLASGGGQQSAVFALLGAQVTVIDLAEGQLAADRKAAEHYKYDLLTLRADMRDLSEIADNSYDLVYQAPSMAYVPDVQQVYAEVARTLRIGGKYRVEFSNPATEFVDMEDWDGKGYRISRRYDDKVRWREDGGVEYRHTLADIFNGLLSVGMPVLQVEESPHHRRAAKDLRPGSWEHWLTYIVGFAIVAKKI